MGQQLFKVDFQNIDSTDAQLNSLEIAYDFDCEHIYFFSPIETDEPTTNNLETVFINKLREHVFSLTYPSELTEIDKEINRILIDEIFPPVKDHYEKTIEQLKLNLENQHKVNQSLTNKFKQDELIADETDQQTNTDNEQISSFAIQSLTSILLILIKSAERNDPTIIQQIIRLTSQLCEQIPIQNSSKLSHNNLLFRGFQPVRDFLDELLLKNDSIVTKAVMKILLHFSVAQFSFKAILPLLARLISDTETIYDVRRLFIQMNKILTASIKLYEQNNNTTTTTFLKSVGVYPTIQLMQLNKKIFTGQFIASVILTYINIDQQMNSNEQLNNHSGQELFSFEFHPQIYQILFDIIKQLTSISRENSSSVIVYMLFICIRLFVTHLKYLSTVHLNFHRRILQTNARIRKILPSSPQTNFDLSQFVNEEQLTSWFELFLDLSHDQNSVSEEASKAIVYLLHLRISSFTDKLSFMHRYIVENQHPILINEFLQELNQKEILLCWIELLRDDYNNNSTERIKTLQILESFIEIYFNSTEQINKEQIEKILLLFQQLLIGQLIRRTADDGSIHEPIDVPSSVVIEYLTYLFRHYLRRTESTLFGSALVGLCLMTNTELFDFMAIQPIFAAILPVLADCMLESFTKEDVISNYHGLLSWLTGKMTFVLITGSPLNASEIKHGEIMESLIFNGGYEKPISEKSTYLSNLLHSNLSNYSQFTLQNDIEESASDKEFLMSVFNNTGDGEQLLTKMKMFLKEKKYLLQQSIEEQANDLVAAVYAVYIKHFDRINLAKMELFQTNQRHTQSHIFSIFEYANRVRTMLRTIKAEGGDCDEFYRQVKANALFLLLSVAKGDSIPSMTEETPSPSIELPPPKPHQFQRQVSRWTKAKHVLKLLRHLMQACVRFKKLMRKKQARQQRVDAESLLSRAIDQFLYKEKALEFDELKKDLDRQHERAITRLITYRFIHTLMQKLLPLTSHPGAVTMRTILLPLLRQPTLTWTCFTNITAANLQLLNKIRNSYHSILHTILPCLLLSASKISMQTLFNYLNFDYTSAGLLSLLNYQFPQKLFPLIDDHSLRTKFLAYNWFRLFTLLLCQNIQSDQSKGKFHPSLEEQRHFLFQSFIRNKLELPQTNKTEDEKHPPDSFQDLAVTWFLHIIRQDFSRFEKDLSINQYLLLLLHCLQVYTHVRLICANVLYIERLLDIYHQSEYKVTRLLALKILCLLIPSLPNYNNDGSKELIEKFLIEILHSIGASFFSQQLTVELVTELIYLYRTVMSRRSAWQLIAINFILNSITLHLNLSSFHSNDTLLASVCILGGYIDQVSLSSIVQVAPDQENNDESRLAMVMETNSDTSPYSIQYLNEIRIGSMTIDRLRVVVQVPPPHLLLLPSVKVSIDSVLDAFGHFLQLYSTVSESLMFLQLKRRCLSALFHLLQDYKMIEIFIAKPYASLIAHLSISGSLATAIDPCFSSKAFLEQYSLRLDMYERSKQIVNNSEDTVGDLEQTHSSHRSIVAALSTPAWKYNGWKPFASKTEIDMWKQGRIRSNKIRLVPFPIAGAKAQVFEKCGQHHQYNGRIVLKDDITGTFPTFIVDNLEVIKGKWYFCVKLPTADVIQIGWATEGFTPECDDEVGIGNDEYSWSYDGSRGVFFHKGAFRRQFNDIRWQKDDICGCGIDIDGDNTNIKYWLNGKLLGTAFKHQENIPRSTKKCNLFPRGPATKFFPGVTLRYRASPANCCEMIFSPEDMQQCPLPAGYKPLLPPTLVHTVNSLVAYPSHAYVVGDSVKDYLYTSRMTPSTSLLRDLVNEDHLTTNFLIDEHGLILSENSDGFPLTVKQECFTIAYDFQLSQTVDEMQMITLIMINNVFIKIPLEKPKQTIRIAMIGNISEQQITVYWNNQNETFQIPFSNETTHHLTLYHLPKIAVKIQNIAVWDYALTEDHVHRLFTYGLFYIAADYQQWHEHKKRTNTFSFTEKQFSNPLLLPFNQPFDENIWEIKKKEADQNEAKYFSSEDSSEIELVENRTYLVLEKSLEPWSEYTIILDVSIGYWPSKSKHWSLVQLNDKSKVFVTHEGKLGLKTGKTAKESDQTLTTDEYYRVWITVDETSCQIFVNGDLQIEMHVKDDRFVAQSNRFFLFQEKESKSKRIKENTWRIRCQSITFLNRSTAMNEQMKTPNSSLQSFVAPPLSIIIPSLIGIGHQPEWIQDVIEQYKTTKISMIDRILREQKGQLERNTLDKKNKRILQVLSTLSSTIDQHKLNELISTWSVSSHNQVTHVGRFILTHWNNLQRTESTDQENERSHDFGSELDMKKWIHDPSIIMIEASGAMQVENRNRSHTEQTLLPPSSDYEDISEEEDSSSSNEEPVHDDSSSSSSDDQNQPLVNTNSDGMFANRLLDLVQEKREELTTLENQRKAMESLQEEISSQQYDQSRMDCEQRLSTIYARDTILNMLKVWSNNSKTLFPLEKFGNSTSIVKLFRLMFSYYTSTEDKIDYMSLTVTSLLKVELNELLDQNLENKPSLLCALQENIYDQIMQFLVEPISLEENSVDEETMIQQENLNFIWKVLNLLLELLKDKSTVKQNQINTLVPLLFPVPMIHLLFKLFLSLESHRSKIVILRLFSNLLQISHTFKLNRQIEQFLFTLLRDFPLNEPKLNSFRLAVMDAVFLLTEQDAESQDNQLPEDVRDLFTTIHIIHVFTDQSKQSPVPEPFFTKSETLLGDGMQLSRRDFDKSNRYFDRQSNLQLIDLTDKNQNLYESFAEFIRSLPTESAPNSTFYQNYPSLSGIPADSVLIRAKVLYQLQVHISQVLFLVDLNLLPGESFLTDSDSKAKIYVPSSNKHKLLDQTMRATESGHNRGHLQVRFNILNAATASENSENTMFHQAYHQLYDKAQDQFRKKDKQIWKAQYLNMHSTDQGGPYRDSITQMCSDICSTRLPLFILCPNGRTNSDSNQDCWIPNVFPPSKSIPEKLKKQYRFVGQLMGLAIRKKHYLNVKFAPLLWKGLLYDSITIDDIQMIDSQSFTLIQEIERQIEQANMIDSNTNVNYIFNSIFSELSFEVMSSAQESFELVPGGSQIPITAENFKEYSFHYGQYRLHEFHRQIDYIRQGLHSVVPAYYLNLFTSSELEEAVCGKGHIDVELLKRNTRYRQGYNENSPVIESFWKVMNEMFTEEQKKMLLIFAWGRSTLPVRDEDFASKFTIAKLRVENDNVDQALPLSHTCTFTIDLPEYSTTEIVYERLDYAITHCSSIDGDGNMNVAVPNNYDYDSNSDDD